MSQRTEKMKRRIVEAAVEVFIEHGFERATLREIAKNAEVTNDFLGRHFAGKLDLINTYFYFRLGDALELISADEAFSDYPLNDRLAALMQSYQVLLRPDREFVDQSLSLSMRSAVMTMGAPECMERIFDEVIRVDLDVAERPHPFHHLVPSWCVLANQLVIAYWMNDCSEDYHKTARLTRFIAKLLANIWNEKPFFEGLDQEDLPEFPFQMPPWAILFSQPAGWGSSMS